MTHQFDNESLIWDNFQTDHVKEGCCENDIDVLGRLGVGGGGGNGPHQGRLPSIVHSNFLIRQNRTRSAKIKKC